MNVLIYQSRNELNSKIDPGNPGLTAAQIGRSLSPDAIMSFEDGRSYKSLRPHLAKLGLSPTLYREKWGLPRDYPMVAENYSRQCCERAKNYRRSLKRKQAKPPEGT